jgi:hypothetical protein
MRAWIPGLSDEAGAGSWLAATMKQFVQPSAAEVTKLESFVAEASQLLQSRKSHSNPTTDTIRFNSECQRHCKKGAHETQLHLCMWY